MGYHYDVEFLLTAEQDNASIDWRFRLGEIYERVIILVALFSPVYAGERVGESLHKSISLSNRQYTLMLTEHWKQV